MKKSVSGLENLDGVVFHLLMQRMLPSHNSYNSLLVVFPPLVIKAKFKPVDLEKHEQRCFFRTQRKTKPGRCGEKQLCASDIIGVVEQKEEHLC